MVGGYYDSSGHPAKTPEAHREAEASAATRILEGQERIRQSNCRVHSPSNTLRERLRRFAYLGCLFEFPQSRHRSCAVVHAPIRIRAPFAFSDRIVF